MALAYDYREEPGTAHREPKSPPRPKRKIKRPRYVRLTRRQFNSREHFAEACEMFHEAEKAAAMMARSETISQAHKAMMDSYEYWHRAAMQHYPAHLRGQSSFYECYRDRADTYFRAAQTISGLR